MPKENDHGRIIISIKKKGKGNHKKEYLYRITKNNCILTEDIAEATFVRTGRVIKYFEILKENYPDCQIKMEKVKIL